MDGPIGALKRTNILEMRRSTIAASSVWPQVPAHRDNVIYGVKAWSSISW
jgi:hypothetical protein